MKRVATIVEILDPKLVDRLIYLDRIVRVYCKFLKEWRTTEVRTDGTLISIKFIKRNKYGYNIWTERIFPIEDLQKRIDGYKRKVRDEWKIRHENQRLIREHDVYKWKKYIRDAQVYL